MRTLTLGPFGITTHRRTLVVGCALLATVTALVVVSLTIGSSSISPLDALKATLGLHTDGSASFIVGQVRAPRALTTLLVGFMLGLSGALLQSLTRNPLASPDFIGITAGASAIAVLTIVLGIGTSLWVTAAGAAIGAVGAATVILALAWKRGLVPLRLVLAGIGIGFVANATTQYLLTRLPIYQVGDALTWLVGSTASRTWQHVTVAAIILAVLLPVVLWHLRGLRTIELGDDTARALGVHVTRTRMVLIACSVLLAAGATALTGPIGFVALVAPAIAVRIARSPGAAPLPSALMGAAILLTADLAAQHLISAVTLPVGIYTSAIGAPYLLWLVWRASRGGPA
ncbi:iron chelate uptake ABC transporter family permease subunit [Demequina capsici]|uniref:Iron chelate uptake ABC transporter family permease subunit n=1 Tax=Demequina capsici TaxID=3075620 RepID=A0AA96FB83_9MICO|nr:MULTISPECIES: iron chelate uptake ABC transporter family permease subunit [unclassified Demequina]WNM25070.1 iron chelate uptake ABC transporter family permease subunit [Demequina sp. OYTSA14]WNM27976.1 iron chelate uptake ABC transporter family permease subunit [Demequina sp. PMTSA13]